MPALAREMLAGCQSSMVSSNCLALSTPSGMDSWGRGPSSQLKSRILPCLWHFLSSDCGGRPPFPPPLESERLVGLYDLLVFFQKTSSKISYNQSRLSKQQHTKSENGWWTQGTGPRVRPPVQPNLDLLPLLLPPFVMWGPWTLGKPEGLCFAKKRRPSALRGPTRETCDMFPTEGLAHCPSGRRSLGVVSQAEELPSCAACLWPVGRKVRDH